MQKIQSNYMGNNYNCKPSFGLKLAPCIFKKTQAMIIDSIKVYRNTYVDYLSQSQTNKLILNDKANHEINIVNKKDINFYLVSRAKNKDIINYNIDNQDRIWISRTKNVDENGHLINGKKLKKIIYVISDLNFKYAKVNSLISKGKMCSDCSFIGKIILNKKIQKILKDLFSLNSKHFTAAI